MPKFIVLLIIVFFIILSLLAFFNKGAVDLTVWNGVTFENIPVIAVTANALTDDVSNGLSSGFDEYLTKPIDIPELNSMLDQYLKPRLIRDSGSWTCSSIYQ